MLRQRRLTRRKPTLPGAEPSDSSTALIASCGWWLRLACPTGFNGCSPAYHTGFVVRPLVAGAAPIRPSAVRDATGHDSSSPTGFVVLSLAERAVIVRSLPFAGGGAAQLRNDAFRGGRGGPRSVPCGLVHGLVENRTTPSPDPSVFADRATAPPRNEDGRMQSRLAPVRQGVNWQGICRQRQNHETSKVRNAVARCPANGRWPNGQGAHYQGPHHESTG